MSKLPSTSNLQRTDTANPPTSRRIQPETAASNVLTALVFHADQWNIAWAQLTSTPGFNWLKRLSSVAAFILLTVAGLSIYGIAQLVFPFLPLLGWILTLCVTTIVAEALVIHFLALAHQRQRSELEERVRPKLMITFEPTSEHPFVQRYEELTQYRVGGIARIRCQTLRWLRIM